MKILFSICIVLICISQTTFAETDNTCPSIESVQHLRNIWPNGEWLPLYIDGEELASMDDIKRFSKNATSFIRAEWSWDFLDAGHCFYAGVNNITLARGMLKPNPDLYAQWKKISEKLFICTSTDENLCAYSGSGMLS